ncbi:MAG: hypothetical protein AB2809_18240 [Candidatus Thiodiazotropha sp.]
MTDCGKTGMAIVAYDELSTPAFSSTIDPSFIKGGPEYLSISSDKRYILLGTRWRLYSDLPSDRQRNNWH